jgi:uncharacterized membrane protein YkgB
MARVALFVVYFWFGLLKVIGQSPASPMVEHLFEKTLGFLPLITSDMFLVLFGLFEMLIGILFIIPKLEKAAIGLFFIHMITTTLPLFILGGEIWTHAFVPTLEGQYIIKNLALIACTLSVWSIIPSQKIQASATL